MNIQIITTNMKIEYLCLITNKLLYTRVLSNFSFYSIIIKIVIYKEMIEMPNLKEDVDVYKMYSKDSTISKDEFLQKYKITENRSFR